MMETVKPASIQSLLGLHPSSQALTDYVAFLASVTPTTNATAPQVKSYPDAVYLNYPTLGLSFLLSPQSGYMPSTGLRYSQLDREKLILDSIDIYNLPPSIPSRDRSDPIATHCAELAFSTFVALPLELSLALGIKDKEGNVLARSPNFVVKPDTTGKDFVATLREPDRKGGGSGPSSGSIGIWCEWSSDGIMVEFGGKEAIGPQAWDRGKDAVWKVLTVFAPDGRK
ncbi:hypothetical protein AX17_000837 [Amanita inopinata Kibby_2008]|nr:hypothetical protein AX17_000837 [Amanita inopinata Kibby_2008]